MTASVAHVVRRATLDDIPGIEAVYRRAWQAAYEPFLDAVELAEVAAGRVRAFDWAASIEASDAEVIVGLEPTGLLTGVAQANEAPGADRDLPEITMLYVDPGAWGTGVATDLLAASTAWIRSRGHRSARLRVAADHLRARRFYEREGWMPDGELDAVSTDLTRLVYYRRTLDEG